MANENRYYRTPFAESGDRSEVPNVSTGGAVGYDTGFGPDYELPQGVVNRKRIERDLYNGLLNGVTDNLKHWQENNYPSWIEDDGSGVAFSYSFGAVVTRAGERWVSNEDGNQEEPSTGDKWSIFNPNKTVIISTDTAETASGRFSVGQLLELTDRANGLFVVVAGGSPNGDYILDAGLGNTAAYSSAGPVRTDGLGGGVDSTENAAKSNAALEKIAAEYPATALEGVRGGEIKLPRGRLTTNESIVLVRHPSGTTGSKITGEGVSSSVFDLDTAPALTDGIASTTGAVLCHLADFGIDNAKRDGVSLGSYSRLTVERVSASNSLSSGFNFGNGFVSVMNEILATGSSGVGIQFDPNLQHTSHVVNAPYALNNSSVGIVWGLMNYSVANGAASDGSGLFGHLIENSAGFIMNAGGAEESQRSGFSVTSSAAIGPTSSVLISNPFCFKNDKAGEGYGNVLYVSASDGVTAKARLIDAHSIPDDGSVTEDVIAIGDGAVITMNRGTLPNGWKSENGGYIDWIHESLVVKSLSVNTATAVCNVVSTQGHNTRYGGRVTVLASNMDPSIGERNTAIYELMISKSIAAGNQVILMASAGMNTGSGASHPSFNWTLVNDQLVATPIAATLGVFFFELTTSSQIVVNRI